jgi:hypothetical protein
MLNDETKKLKKIMSKKNLDSTGVNLTTNRPQYEIKIKN